MNQSANNPDDSGTAGVPGDGDGTGDWDETTWIQQTAHIRAAMNAMGIHVPDCMPGGEHPCGQSAASHYASYLGLLTQRTYMSWANLDPGQIRVAVTAFRDSARIDHSEEALRMVEQMVGPAAVQWPDTAPEDDTPGMAQAVLDTARQMENAAFDALPCTDAVLAQQALTPPATWHVFARQFVPQTAGSIAAAIAAIAHQYLEIHAQLRFLDAKAQGGAEMTCDETRELAQARQQTETLWTVLSRFAAALEITGKATTATWPTTTARP